ncbi:MAG: DAK2 domain-containing protein [Clostridia bacterium]|nr:DAK2 domain-containing protein [Clostridia bacterium]
MLKQLNGAALLDLLKGGIDNIEKHRSYLNELNVFPVPDGDTGTNMLMTLRYGMNGVKDAEASAGVLAKQFATAAVFGARGNSGVILSQFFKGIAEVLDTESEPDTALFTRALSTGYRLAYGAVAKPVEGTILTVMRDAASVTEAAEPFADFDALVAVYLEEARASLARTPSLLPVLKKAGVVDSGASGLVAFFEGVQKRLRGEEIVIDEPAAAETSAPQAPDLSLVNKDTDFSLGYCTEGLIQLKTDAANFDALAFGKGLEQLGSSIVASLEGDKLKLHIHTRRPGRVLEYCQQIGEMLTVKIENMTLQHLGREKSTKKAEKFLVAEGAGATTFAVVAVATTVQMQQTFLAMGADVVILGDIAPSSGDFMEAFALTKAKDILVFPNSANSILSSMQAGGLYREGRVTVLNCRSMGECYASLSVMDFDGSADEAVSAAKSTIAGLYEIGIYHATKDATYGSKQIAKNAFFSLSDKKILQIGTSLREVTLETVKKTMADADYNVLTIFCGKDMAEEYISNLIEKIEALGLDLEVAAVYTEDTLYSLSLLFE